MHKNFTDFYKAWSFLENHPMFDYEGINEFRICLDIYVVKVNLETREIENNESKNTETRVWLECGPYLRPKDLKEDERKNWPYGTCSHDYDLDCGAPTFEEAIIVLANLVMKKYGKRGRKGRNIILNPLGEIIRKKIQESLKEIEAGNYVSLEQLKAGLK